MNKKPNAFIIGVQKAGTTSLFNWLSQHPEVCAPEAMKDFHFFSNDEHYFKGQQFYLKNFEHCKDSKIILGGGVNHMYIKKSAKRIFEFNKESKFYIQVLTNISFRDNSGDKVILSVSYYKIRLLNCDLLP
jgi:hypothetical protein